MTTEEFAKANQIFDCGDSGRDLAADVQIPTIPENGQVQSFGKFGFNLT